MDVIGIFGALLARRPLVLGLVAELFEVGFDGHFVFVARVVAANADGFAHGAKIGRLFYVGRILDIHPLDYMIVKELHNSFSSFLYKISIPFDFFRNDCDMFVMMNTVRFF